MWKALAGIALTRSPPCKAVYSNLGVAIVGELLSERYQVPWDALVAQRITGPRGMNDTVRSLGDRRSRLAPGFQGSSPVNPWEFDAFRGAGSLHSTPADLLRFGRVLIAGAAGPLGPAAERLLKPLAWFEGEIGYAIFVRGPEAHRTYVHTGLTGGYASQLVLAPDTDEVVVILASNSEAPVFRVGNIPAVEPLSLESEQRSLGGRSSASWRLCRGTRSTRRERSPIPLKTASCTTTSPVIASSR